MVYNISFWSKSNQGPADANPTNGNLQLDLFSVSLWCGCPRCDREVQAWQDAMFEGGALGHGAAASLLKHFITVC